MGLNLSKPIKDKIKRLLKEHEGTTALDRLVATETGVSQETVRRIRRELGIKAGKGGRPKLKKNKQTMPAVKIQKQADDLTRADRLIRLEGKIRNDPKYRVLKETLDDAEYDMFIAEFVNIAADMDSLDSFEESHLYTAIMNFVIGTRYARRYQQQRKAYGRFCKSDFYGRTDLRIEDIPRDLRASPPSESLMEEFHKSNDNFNKIRDKFARIQEEKRRRLVRDKKSFSDFLEYYAGEDRRREAAMEIADINKKTDAELKRMIEMHELEGYFGS